MKKYVKIAIVLIFIGFFADRYLPGILDHWNRNNPQSHVLNGNGTPQVIETPQNFPLGVTVIGGGEDRKFNVSPQNLKPGNILTIILPNVHPTCFAIKAPGNRWIDLVDPDIPIGSVNTIDLGKTNEIKLPLGQFKGIYWENGVKKTVYVFTRSGKYLLYFADNLETEPDNTYFLEEPVNFKAE